MNSDQEWGCEWTLVAMEKEGRFQFGFFSSASPLWGHCGA